jgi:hypothetical protein
MVIIKVKTKPQVFFDCYAQRILMNREEKTKAVNIENSNNNNNNNNNNK